MIGIKDMYAMYIGSVRNNIANYESSLENLKNSQEYMLNKIKPYKLFIEHFTKINYDNINTLKLIISIEDDVFNFKTSNEIEITDRIKFTTDINALSYDRLKNEYNQQQ